MRRNRVRRTVTPQWCAPHDRGYPRLQLGALRPGRKAEQFPKGGRMGRLLSKGDGTMTTWLAAPSARPVAEVEPWVALWQSKGYLVSLWRDPGAGVPENADEVVVAPYPGWARAANELIEDVFRTDPTCDWVVTAGDDTEPDACHTADEIAAQCSAHFRQRHWTNAEIQSS